jgi:hypothetical protein
MARQYRIQGTREFLIWSIGLGLLCVWAIRDGWFPTESTITKHGPPDQPLDSFYLFNQSLAVLSGVGTVVCAVIHRIVK